MLTDEHAPKGMVKYGQTDRIINNNNKEDNPEDCQNTTKRLPEDYQKTTRR